MKNLSFEKFLVEQYHPMNADSKELDYLLECIDGLNSDTQIREHLDSLDNEISISEELLTEKKIRFKRKYGERPHLEGYTKTKVRNDILEYIDKMGIVPQSQMDMFIEMLGEEREGDKPSKSWFYKNKHLIKISESDGKKFYQLTKYGKRILERVKKAIGDSKVAEAAIEKLKKDVDRLDEARPEVMAKEVEKVASKLIKKGFEVSIDYSMGSIEVTDKRGDVVYSAQGDDFENTMEEVELGSSKFDVGDDEYLLYFLDSSGVL